MDDNKNWILNTNQHITMISAESFEAKDWSNADKKINLCQHRTHFILKYIKSESS